MSLTVSITTTDTIGPVVEKLTRALGQKRLLHVFIAPRAEAITRDYLVIQARARHKTANRLGAQPTGHLSRAAESVVSRATEAEATVGIVSPGIARAVRPLEIKPKAPRKWLTIPAVGSVYGKRAREQKDLVFLKFKKGKSAALVEGERYRVTRGKNKGQMKMRPVINTNGKPMIVFFLVKSSRLPMDRTLLPSDELYTEAARAGINDLLNAIEGNDPKGGAA